MTKKDFQLIADTIAGLPIRFDYAEPTEFRDDVAAEFARVLGRTNPRFDCDRFLRACGVGNHE